MVAGLWLGEGAILLLAPSRPMPWAIGGLGLLLGSLMVAMLSRAARLRGAASPADQAPGDEPPTSPDHRVGAPGRALVSALVAAGLILGVGVGALHLARLHPPVLRAATAQAAVLHVEATITGDPVMHLPPDDGGRAQPPSWSILARVTELTVRGRTYRLRVPTVLRGDAVRDLRYGAQVSLPARAQEPWAAHEQSMALRILGPVDIRSPPGPLAAGSSHVREALRESVAGLPTDAAALLLGLAVGDESLLPADLDRAMVRSGLAHLTAVSGSNTSLVAGIALAAAVGLGLGWRSRVTASLVVLSAYVLLVRPQPSVLRAAAMGVVALIALSAGGRRRGPPALLGSGLVLLLALPQFALSIGFGLSFAATAGLLVVGPPIADRLGQWPATRWVPEPIRAALAVATAAHLATLPLAILLGNGASLVALPANVLVTPLVPFATVLGLAAALVAPFLPGAAAVLAAVAAPATAAIAKVARIGSDLPFGVLEVPAGAGGALGAAAVLALIGWAAIRGWRPWRHPRVLPLAACAVALIVTIQVGRAARWPPPDWVVLACDVGQGDGLLIRAPGAQEALLVDAGPDGRRIRRCLEDSGVRQVTVLISHFHADHIDGLAEVLAGWPVPGVLATPVGIPAEGADQVLAATRSAGVPLRLVRAGDRLRVAGVPLQVLWPARTVDESPANNGSVVAVASVATGAGPVDVLVTGDIEPEAQTALLAGAPPGAEVVKVPHHGSRYQATGFAAWSGARLALVSAGRDNDYGHPSQSTLDQYRDAGARIGRTDVHGALAVVTRPGGIALIAQR
ncbi:MAG: ComEC/Rec2 family competence protein [Candidatus Nanopelagicales bacterium]